MKRISQLFAALIAAEQDHRMSNTNRLFVALIITQVMLIALLVYHAILITP